MSDIKAGDLVVVLRCCCVDEKTGHIGTVSEVFFARRACGKCGLNYTGIPAAFLDGDRGHGFALSWLKRIPPLDELERDQMIEELTA